MNFNATRAMAKKITSTTKFDNLTLVENGLVLYYGKKQLSTISFSGVDKIYIKVYKLKPIYGSIFVSFLMLLAFLYFESAQLNVEFYLALLPVIPAFVKINRFKRYGLVLVLKNGSVFTKKVPLKLKSDTVELINEVKRNRAHFNLHHPKANTVSINRTEAAIDYQPKNLFPVIPLFRSVVPVRKAIINCVVSSKDYGLLGIKNQKVKQIKFAGIANHQLKAD